MIRAGMEEPGRINLDEQRILNRQEHFRSGVMFEAMLVWAQLAHPIAGGRMQDGSGLIQCPDFAATCLAKEAGPPLQPRAQDL